MKLVSEGPNSYGIRTPRCSVSTPRIPVRQASAFERYAAPDVPIAHRHRVRRQRLALVGAQLHGLAVWRDSAL